MNMLFVRRYARSVIAGLCLGVLLGLIIVVVEPPAHFPSKQLIAIPAGASSPAIGKILQESHVIRSAFIFNLIARVTGDATHFSGGTYSFTKPVSVFTIASRVAHGDYGIAKDRITLTEGMTTKDMAEAFEASLAGFNRDRFLNAASTSEGYLFPDTYFILPGTSESKIVDRLRATFAMRIASSSSTFTVSGHTQQDIIIMASILEREAKSPDDMRHVAGILWNRIRLGMPLQVDAVFGYIHGINGYTPTAVDLASDSPYNTYIQKGLPPTPIDNPGLSAILAAASPLKTSDLYYLTGKDALMHYAKSFEEHKKNRAKYLDI